MKQLLLILSFISYFCLPSFSQERDSLRFHTRHFTTLQGLPSNAIRCLHQDKQGFLWIGTENGLSRYDGTSFHNIHTNLNNFGQPGLSRNIVERMREHRQRLWITCSDKRLCCYDLRQGAFVDYTGCGEFDDIFSNLYFMSSGKVWINNSTYLRIVSEDGNRNLSSKTIAINDSDSLSFSDGVKGVVGFIKEDSLQQTWIGTNLGLWCYNADEELVLKDSTSNWLRASVYRHSLLAVTKNGDFWMFSGDKKQMLASLSRMEAKPTVADAFLLSGHYYVLSREGVYRMDVESRSLSCVAKKNFTRASVKSTTEKGAWIYDEADFTYYLDAKTGKLRQIDFASSKGPRSRSFRISYDKEENVWLSPGNKGVYYYEPSTDYLEQILFYEQPTLLSNNRLHCLLVTSDNKVWIGSDLAGLTQLTRLNQSVQRIFPFNSGDMQIANYVRLVRCIGDTLWVANRQNDLAAFDSRSLRLLKRYTMPSKIYAISLDNQGNCWIGTKGGGAMLKNVPDYGLSNLKEGGIRSKEVYDLHCDASGRMWLATFVAGVALAEPDKYTPGNYHFRHFFVNNMTVNAGIQCARDIAEDYWGRLWVATNDGICVFNPDSLINNPESYQHFSYNNGTFCIGEVLTLCVSPSGKEVWAGTTNGLVRCILDREGKHLSYKLYGVDKGLNSPTVNSLVFDKKERLWIGTQMGLTILNTETEQFQSFRTDMDNLRYDVFSEQSACMLPDGRLLFGSRYGFVVIDPEQIAVNEQAPRVVFTNLLVQGARLSEYDGEEESDVSLSRTISYTDSFELPHNRNSFEVQFSAMDYNADLLTRYSYRIEGMDNTWSEPTSRNFVILQDLRPGSYRLHVKACSPSGIWSKEASVMNFCILPPWWQTWWAIMSVLILLCLTSFFIIRQVRSNIQMRRTIIEEKRLSHYKMMLFTNISHEFRTPLTLLKVAMHRLQEDTSFVRQNKATISIMSKGMDRMLRLSNQLLEFRKMQEGKLGLRVERTEVVSFVKSIVDSFTEAAQQKDISFSFTPSCDNYTMLIDRSHLDKICYNLFSNAIKYTPEHGQATVVLNFDEQKRQMKMIVSDNGIGVDQEKRMQLFGRYMQSRMTGNSMGIGLNLSYELANRHYGSLIFAPNHTEEGVEKGSIFTLTLPIAEEIYQEDEFMIFSTNADENSSTPQKSDEMTVEENTIEDKEVDINIGEGIEEIVLPINGQRVLIVEDDLDVRQLLVLEISRYFEVLTATNGMEALEIAREKMPDLIVSDVMMPEMDGFKLTRKLKTDLQTCHIPIILLTALGAPDSHVHGIEEGADVYMTKPFNAELLRASIVQLITNRRRLREKYSKEPAVKTEEICTNSRDKEYMAIIDRVIDEHLSEAEFSIEAFATAMNTSRTVLFNKVKNITGVAPSEYLRLARLKKACEMLKRMPDKNISEIAYEVGFSDPLYFSKTFKKQFDLTPSQYRQEG